MTSYLEWKKIPCLIKMSLIQKSCHEATDNNADNIIIIVTLKWKIFTSLPQHNCNWQLHPTQIIMRRTNINSWLDRTYYTVSTSFTNDKIISFIYNSHKGKKYNHIFVLNLRPLWRSQTYASIHLKFLTSFILLWISFLQFLISDYF